MYPKEIHGVKWSLRLPRPKLSTIRLKTAARMHSGPPMSKLRKSPAA